MAFINYDFQAFGKKSLTAASKCVMYVEVGLDRMQ